MLQVERQSRGRDGKRMRRRRRLWRSSITAATLSSLSVEELGGLDVALCSLVFPKGKKDVSLIHSNGSVEYY